MNDDVFHEVTLPLEFMVSGTPVSLQGSPKSKSAWKQEVRKAVHATVPEGAWLFEHKISVTIYDFPADTPAGDVDNIVKVILDAMNGTVYADDNQVARVAVQRFLPEEVANFTDPPNVVAKAMAIGDPPFVFIRVSDDPIGEAQ
ncbi:RusA family crossover junction endodeoxyribonuclease [Leisingera daeponensis]|uniref:RusA family crossover junction endodeoxyribonuclease n=1 Tax=Leisingera daeponensis TaxID=405746 RepID=A0ABS7NFE8_9RHOB|nr:RusA family crossover junction endodeoxyribonuclease [Leisingera daeponensis]MBY6138816.1 RusA family crossover junction endodeoxyribonuclease [Leisingera daeponensis]